MCVKVVATSTVVNPVTQTDVVAVNKASTKWIGRVVALGNISSPAPIRITKMKLSRKSKDGFMCVCINVNVCLERWMTLNSRIIV